MLNQIQPFRLKLFGIGTLLGLSFFSTVHPVSAAETVILKYGIFSQSIPVSALTGGSSDSQGSGELQALLKVISPDDRPSILRLLDTTLPFGVLQVDQIIKSPVGEKFLNELAAATILPGDSEVKALRSAALVTAAEDKSLSFSGMLKRYPTQTLTVNLPLLIKTFRSNGPALGALLGGQGQTFSPPPTNRP